MSVLRRRPWSVAADCSMPARQPQETHGHRGWTDELTAPATSVSRQSVDGDQRRFRMLAAGFLLDTPVLCHAHNDTQEHTTGTGFAPVRVASSVPGAVESCVPMSDASRQAERQRSALTAVSPADIPRYPQSKSKSTCKRHSACVVFNVVILVFCYVYVPSKSTYGRYSNLIPLSGRQYRNNTSKPSRKYSIGLRRDSLA